MRRRKADTPAPEQPNEPCVDDTGGFAEDLPAEPLPAKGLPLVTTIDVDEDERKVTRDSGKGLDKALEILDEYEKGVPPRNPHVQNYEE